MSDQPRDSRSFFIFHLAAKMACRSVDLTASHENSLPRK
jgi:hypothetical protein